MAALLGTNTALMLFQGIEQAKLPTPYGELALSIIAAALPFQGIYFLIYTFLLEHEPHLPEERIPNSTSPLHSAKSSPMHHWSVLR